MIEEKGSPAAYVARIGAQLVTQCIMREGVAHRGFVHMREGYHGCPKRFLWMMTIFIYTIYVFLYHINWRGDGEGWREGDDIYNVGDIYNE